MAHVRHVTCDAGHVRDAESGDCITFIHMICACIAGIRVFCPCMVVALHIQCHLQCHLQSSRFSVHPGLRLLLLLRCRTGLGPDDALPHLGRLVPSLLPQPEPVRVVCQMHAGGAGIVLEVLDGDVRQVRSASQLCFVGVGRRVHRPVPAEGRVQEPLPQEVVVGALPAGVGGFQLAHGGPHDVPHDQIHMFRAEDAEQQSPALDGRGFAVGTGLAAAEHVEQGGAGDAAHPGQKPQRVEPGSDRVGAQGQGTTAFDHDLEKVRPQLNPVVDQEGDRHQRPDGGEERQIAKLDAHLAQVVRHVVVGEVGLVAGPLEELAFLGRVVKRDGGGVFLAVGVVAARRPAAVLGPAVLLARVFLVLAQEVLLHERQDRLHAKADDLSRHGEVDHLLAQPVRVNAELRVRRGFLLGHEGPHGHLENVQVRGDQTGKRHVDKRRQEDGEVGRDEVNDKDLARQGRVVGIVGLVILILVEFGRDRGQHGTHGRNQCREEDGGDEDLSISSSRFLSWGCGQARDDVPGKSLTVRCTPPR